MLKLEFNEDGSRKALDEIIAQRDTKISELEKAGKDSSELKGLYSDILTNYICYDIPDEKLIETARRLGKEKMKSIFEDISSNAKENTELQLQYLKSVDDYAKNLNNGTFSLNDKYEASLDFVESGIIDNNKEIEDKINSQYDVVKNIRKFYKKQEDIDKSLENEKEDNTQTAKIRGSSADDLGNDMLSERYLNIKELFKPRNQDRTPSDIGTINRDKLKELKDTSKEYKRQINIKEDILEESLACINAAELLINDRFRDTDTKQRDIHLEDR